MKFHEDILNGLKVSRRNYLGTERRPCRPYSYGIEDTILWQKLLLTTSKGA